MPALVQRLPQWSYFFTLEFLDPLQYPNAYCTMGHDIQYVHTEVYTTNVRVSVAGSKLPLVCVICMLQWLGHFAFRTYHKIHKPISFIVACVIWLFMVNILLYLQKLGIYVYRLFSRSLWKLFGLLRIILSNVVIICNTRCAISSATQTPFCPFSGAVRSVSGRSTLLPHHILLLGGFSSPVLPLPQLLLCTTCKFHTIKLHSKVVQSNIFNFCNITAMFYNLGTVN